MVGKFGLSDLRYTQLSKYYSDNDIKRLVKYWGVKRCESGYATVDWEGLGLARIEKIDELRVFSSDNAAINQAIKDGVKLIPLRDLPDGLPDDMYSRGWVDNLTNRMNIKKYVQDADTLFIKAYNDVKQRFDKIIDTYEDDSFVEITGINGGDTETFRVYRNGTVTQR